MGPWYAVMVPRIPQRPIVVNYIATAVAYMFLIIGLNFFVLPLKSWVAGGLFGLVGYGAYSFTATAVFRGWEAHLALVETLWGGFLYAAASFIPLQLHK